MAQGMTFERTYDWELIKKIVTHPKVWPHISDDFTPKPEGWSTPQSPAIIYMLIKDSSDIIGLMIFHPENAVCLETHICMLPIAYGERTREAVRGALQWIWDNTNCRRVVGRIPVYNTLAIACAIATGFSKFGLNPKSYMKDGILHDIVELGISKTEATCPGAQ
jgi:RimJ/RimL family protein N-acetyltransferase